MRAHCDVERLNAGDVAAIDVGRNSSESSEKMLGFSIHIEPTKFHIMQECLVNVVDIKILESRLRKHAFADNKRPVSDALDKTKC